MWKNDGVGIQILKSVTLMVPGDYGDALVTR